MMDTAPNYRRILDSIAACYDSDKLTAFMTNARKRKAAEVEEAALKQLKSLIPPYKKGSYERSFWDMLLGYQAVLFDHGKPTTKLNKALKLALNEGEVKAHIEWIESGSQAWALRYFQTYSAKSITAEGLALKFSDKFDAQTLHAATQNLHLAKASLLEMN